MASTAGTGWAPPAGRSSRSHQHHTQTADPAVRSAPPTGQSCRTYPGTTWSLSRIRKCHTVRWWGPFARCCRGWGWVGVQGLRSRGARWWRSPLWGQRRGRPGSAAGRRRGRTRRPAAGSRAAWGVSWRRRWLFNWTRDAESASCNRCSYCGFAISDLRVLVPWGE